MADNPAALNQAAADKAAGEFIARGLISVLKLEKDKQYIIFLRRDAFAETTVVALTKYIQGSLGMDNVAIRFEGPGTADEVVKVIAQ